MHCPKLRSSNNPPPSNFLTIPKIRRVSEITTANRGKKKKYTYTQDTSGEQKKTGDLFWRNEWLAITSLDRQDYRRRLGGIALLAVSLPSLSSS
ncbi:hypothetical protein TNCT_452591 [Trichonephila clavata]|uniref:Uncharacterized protein n=1 Tax=Trichonephila clavata TaxID=2740835 RepID=A0A8X6ILU8_TRICU|nr:hypothetical protein TNCT_452591 [Trichonephila clavata]